MSVKMAVYCMCIYTDSLSYLAKKNFTYHVQSKLVSSKAAKQAGKAKARNPVITSYRGNRKNKVNQARIEPRIQSPGAIDTIN